MELVVAHLVFVTRDDADHMGENQNPLRTLIRDAKSGVRMPHFFAYALGALVVMIPVFIAATYLFFPPS